MMLQLPQLRVAWRDGSGNTAESRFTIGSNLPVATIESVAPSLVAALSAVSDAAVTGYEIVYNVVPAGMVVPGPGADNLRAGVFIFQDDGSEDIGLVEVHSIVEDVLETSGPGAGVLIIQSDSRVIAFVDALSAAGATNPFAAPLGALVAAYRQSRT